MRSCASGRGGELKPEDALLVLIAFAAACALFPHGWTAYWSTSAEALFPRLAWQWLIFALLAGWVVLRLLRRVSGGDTQELFEALPCAAYPRGGVLCL